MLAGGTCLKTGTWVGARFAWINSWARLRKATPSSRVASRRAPGPLDSDPVDPRAAVCGEFLERSQTHTLHQTVDSATCQTSRQTDSRSKHVTCRTKEKATKGGRTIAIPLAKALEGLFGCCNRGRPVNHCRTKPIVTTVSELATVDTTAYQQPRPKASKATTQRKAISNPKFIFFLKKNWKRLMP